MCPPSDTPPASAVQGDGARHVDPVFVVDAAAGLLLDANAGGLRAWGLEGADHLPVALDGAMPALQKLRELAGGPDAGHAIEETLTIWTQWGSRQLCCRIHAGDPALVTVRVVAPLPEETVAARLPVDGACEASAARIALDARLAHELRTPLSAVIAYAEIMKDEHFGPLANPRYRGYARDIYEGARHALSVIDSMLRGEAEPSLVPPLAFADIEPARVVESCVAVVRPLAERAGLELSVAVAPRLPRIVADELSLKQMLLNLLTNAVKFARDGDRVTVAILYDGGGPLTITVSDTGPGIDRQALEELRAGDDAGPPEKVSAGGVSLGLGLPLTRALAAANGAALAIDSEVGRGTRASIAFGQDRLVPV